MSKSPIHRRFGFMWIVLWTCWTGAAGCTKTPEFTVAENDAGTTITVMAKKGRISWDRVLCALAQAKGFDESALEGLAPGMTFDPNSVASRLLIGALNRALAPGIEMTPLEPTDRRGKSQLQIRLDRRAMLATERRLKARLREGFSGKRTLGTGVQGKSTPLTLDPNWENSPPERRLVLFVHGLHATPQRFYDFAAEVRAKGFAAGTVTYPNDQAVEDSARMLAAELDDIARLQPGREVALVTTSMGGLVARAVVEDPGRDPGNVRQLIMIAPPNHGSALAEFAFAVEVWEHVVEQRSRTAAEQFYASIEDGLGEAYDDLRPGSDFLRRLNARPRNPNIQYSIFLGDAAYLNAADVEAMREKILGAGQLNRFVRFLGPRFKAIFADLDELIAGRGDGAVSIERGRLEGVEDVVVLSFDHAWMVRRAWTVGERQLRQQIVERLTNPHN